MTGIDWISSSGGLSVGVSNNTVGRILGGAYAVKCRLSSLGEYRRCPAIDPSCSSVAIPLGFPILRRFSTLPPSLAGSETPSNSGFRLLITDRLITSNTNDSEKVDHLAHWISREIAPEAAAVIGPEWTWWMLRRRCEGEDEAEVARIMVQSALRSSGVDLSSSNTRTTARLQVCLWMICGQLADSGEADGTCMLARGRQSGSHAHKQRWRWKRPPEIRNLRGPGMAWGVSFTLGLE